jgi:hypothetical protein
MQGDQSMRETSFDLARKSTLHIVAFTMDFVANALSNAASRRLAFGKALNRISET